MGPTERSIPSLLDLMTEDNASPRDGRPLSAERVYQANTMTREQYLAILDEWAEERRREQNGAAVRDLAADSALLAERMARCNVPKTLIGVIADMTCGEALSKGRWLYIHSPSNTTAAQRACMALKGWLRFERFGIGEYQRSASVLSGLRSSEEDEMRRLSYVGLLVLTGLGTEAATDWAIGKLYELLDARALNGRPTIISSPCKPEELASHLAGRGNDIAARSILRIIMERSAMVEA